METINLFGASGHGKVIKDIIEAERNKVGVFYDDAPIYTNIHGISVIKTTDAIVTGPLIISIGSNNIRKLIVERYDVTFAKAIHPTASVAPTVKVGNGTVIMQGAIIQSDTVIGTHCIINSGASVDHECLIADFVHISPHATLCGNVKVGEGSWIGAGATVIPGVKIGKWCTIGAGSTVIEDIHDGCTVVGTPAKDINTTYNTLSMSRLHNRGG